MRLVIVESPKKARTISGFLGAGYRVAASMGHVRDLPPKTLGVDVQADFRPEYVVLPRAQKALAALRKAASGAESVLLATDPDREGEAIAWHLAHALRLPQSRYRRVTFHEISRRAIQEALAHPRDLDSNLIDAQQARRVLDRLVGYQLSPLLWRKVQRGTSAGRVQSVAVRLVVDREREILAFVPVEFWTIDVRLSPLGATSAESSFLARLQEVDGKKAEVEDEPTAMSLAEHLRRSAYRVRETSQKEQQRQPFPPFTTSTLQQAAGNRLRFPAKKTMSAAQALYEAGLITYMRTDSVAVSQEAIGQARRLIAAEFGRQYVPASPRRYATRTKNAQEAHEAIRPVDLAKSPAALRRSLGQDEWRIYDLIWKRMVASQMAAARYLQDVAIVDAAFPGGAAPKVWPAADAVERRFTLKAQASRLVFPGWLAVYGEEADSGAGGSSTPRGAQASEAPAEGEAPANRSLPPLEPRQPLRCDEVIPEQHFTQPPRRYTEATLVKALEDAGVGRPSTYATVVSTIQDRGYVQLEQRHFVPTEVGFAANDFLVAHFPRIVDLPFTAEMEDSLDEIAGGRREWTGMLRDFYGPFAQTVAQAQGVAITPLKHAERAGTPAPPTAGAAIVRSAGRPARRTARAPRATASSTSARPASSAAFAPIAGASLPGGAETPLVAPPQTCPQCGKPLVARRSQYGPFLGCSGFPACRYIFRDEAEHSGPRPRTRATRRPRTGPARKRAAGASPTKSAPQARRAMLPTTRSAGGPPSPLTRNVVRATTRRRGSPPDQ